MIYDFAEFLKKASKYCSTKQDLVDRANREILKMERNIKLKPPSLFQQQLYLKRLEGTVFAVKNRQFKDNDPYNNELAELLERLP